MAPSATNTTQVEQTTDGDINLKAVTGAKKQMLFLRPPKFDSPQEAREHIKRKLTAAFRILADHGLDEGVGKSFTASRAPRRADRALRSWPLDRPRPVRPSLPSIAGREMCRLTDRA